MNWILSICIGASSWGCGAFREAVFPSQQACFQALASMRTGDQPTAESGLKRNTVAYCAPAPEGKK